MVTDLRYGTLTLAAARAGVPLLTLVDEIGVSAKTCYTWSKRGIPKARTAQVSAIVERLRASAVADFDFRTECKNAGVSQISVARFLGCDRQYERWGAIGVPPHLRPRVIHAIHCLSELARCRSEMASTPGYVPVGQGVEV